VHKDWLCLEFAPDVLFAQKKLVCDEVEVIEFFVKFRFQIWIRTNCEWKGCEESARRL